MVEGAPAQKEEPVLGPIIASIGESHVHYMETPGWEDLQRSSKFVEYHTHPNILKQSPMRNAGANSYVMSEIDEYPKHSDDYRDCTGLAAVGVDKETGRNISFLTHQDPVSFLHQKRGEFDTHLRELLREFKERVKPETIDIMLFGGNYADSQEVKGNTLADHYRQSVQFISSIVREELDRDLHVAMGPSDPHRGSIAGLLDTRNRRIFIDYPEQLTSQFHVAFPASDLDAVEENWRKNA